MTFLPTIGYDNFYWQMGGMKLSEPSQEFSDIPLDNLVNETISSSDNSSKWTNLIYNIVVVVFSMTFAIALTKDTSRNMLYIWPAIFAFVMVVIVVKQ